MFDHSVYNAQNECSETGYEVVAYSLKLPDGKVLRVFRDNFGQYRAVAFKSAMHKVGYSGVLLNADGSAKWKTTAPSMRGQNTTRQLVAFMVSLGIHWMRSEHETTAGAACFK